MATVISLEAYRQRRSPLDAAMARLEGAIARLDPLVRRPGGRLGGRVQNDLAAIASEVAGGRPAQAADIAERLADLLEHPVAFA